MKKNLLRAVFVAALGLGVGYTLYNSQKESTDLSYVILDNIEALASGYEGGFGCQTDSNYNSICSYYESGPYCPCGF